MATEIVRALARRETAIVLCLLLHASVKLLRLVVVLTIVDFVEQVRIVDTKNLVHQ